MMTLILFFLIGFTELEAKAKPSSVEPNIEESGNNDKFDKQEELDTEEFSPSFLELKTVLQLKNNQLRQNPYKWSVSNPYTEITWQKKFLKDNVFKLGLEFSYENQNWDYFISQWFFKHTFSFWIPIQLQWGYFEIEYIDSNDLLVSKIPLVEQKLFPHGEEALGLSLISRWDSGWSFIVALRYNDYQKASLDLTTSNQKGIGSAHAIYKKYNQQLFAGAFIEDRAGLGYTQSLGLGSDLHWQHSFISLKLKNELWSIQNKKSKNWVWYMFPYVKLFDRVGLGWFVGSFKQKTNHGSSQQSETVLKADFYLKDSIYLSLENIQEYSSVYSQNSWNLALKTNFTIPTKK